ncbi:MAG: hypothetical protein ABUT39_22420 [Acidobacteriota bacterium]
MKRAAICLGLLMMVLPFCAASAAEPPLALTAPKSCAPAATTLTGPLSTLELEIFSPSETRPTDMSILCCGTLGCCTLIENGCEPCTGGERWYTKFSCPGGGTCTQRASKCPTAC